VLGVAIGGRLHAATGREPISAALVAPGS